MQTDLITLNYDAIIDRLRDMAVSDAAKDALSKLEPIDNEELLRRRMEETSAARLILDAAGNPPLSLMNKLDETLGAAEIGSMLSCAQLTGAALFAADCRRMAAYLRRSEYLNPALAALGRSFDDLEALRAEIESRVDEESVLDGASPLLRDIRRKAQGLTERIREKLNHVLVSRKEYLSDNYITTRNGRYVLPVKRACQYQFGGSAVDSSGKGGTVFMEPNCVVSLREELDGLKGEEDAEERRILYELSGRIVESAAAMRRNMELMTAMDALFAKAKLSAQMKARPVEIDAERSLIIVDGRHPLLDADSCVPLNIRIGAEDAGVVITGPNTGGKTIAIKTVGLLSAMAQSGLHVPCGEGSRFAMYDHYLADIGDSQSLSQNLSTFSGHMTSIIRILNCASRDSLVLLDEPGCGTDPDEGMGIAVAVLEELRLRGCRFLATTHYACVKDYAEGARGVCAARMAFDPETLSPLFRLEMGRSGESCALLIAGRLGMPPALLDRARLSAYEGRHVPEGARPAMKAPPSGLTRRGPERTGGSIAEKFSMGDCVTLPGGETGIVYRPADEGGNVVVQVKGEKKSYRHNRLRLKVPAKELYPEDYDFSILFDSVANRKAAHILGKRYDASAEIVHREPDSHQSASPGPSSRRTLR